jgi:hypothetical protein
MAIGGTMRLQPLTRKQALDSLAEFQRLIERLYDSRDAVVDYLNKRLAAPVGDEGACATVLRNALNNETGWREEARAVLGIQRMVPCENCGSPFPSGGRRRIYCGNCETPTYKKRANI